MNGYDTPCGGHSAGFLRGAREGKPLVAFPADVMKQAAEPRSPTHDMLVSINIELDSLEKGFTALEERLRIVLTPPSPENEAPGREQQPPGTPLQESLLAIIGRVMYLRRILNHLSTRIDL